MSGDMGDMFGRMKAEMLQQRTELEVLLRQSLDDVKAEILRRLGKLPCLSQLALCRF